MTGTRDMGQGHGDKNDICLLSCLPMLKWKVGLQADERWSENKLTAIVLLKANF